MICKQTNPLLSVDSTHRIDVGTIQVTKGTENNFYQIVHTQCVTHFIKEGIFSKFFTDTASIIVDPPHFG